MATFALIASPKPHQTSGHSTTTTIGVLIPRPMVHHLSYNPGSCRFCAGLGLDSGGCDGRRAGVRCRLKILGLTWVELGAGWGLLLVSCRGMLWFYFERWCLQGGLHSLLDFSKDAIFSHRILATAPRLLLPFLVIAGSLLSCD